MRHAMALLVPLAILGSTGCSIVGKWSMASIEPEAARRDFEFASLTLQKDGSFYAEAQSTVSQAQVQTESGGSFYAESKEPGVRSASGTYVYKDNTLTLTTHAGVHVPYEAHLTSNNSLRLDKFWQGRQVKAQFKRVE